MKKPLIVSKELLALAPLSESQREKILQSPTLGYSSRESKELSHSNSIIINGSVYASSLMFINEIAPGSQMLETPIRPGMYILSVDGVRFAALKGSKDKSTKPIEFVFYREEASLAPAKFDMTEDWEEDDYEEEMPQVKCRTSLCEFLKEGTTVEVVYAFYPVDPNSTRTQGGPPPVLKTAKCNLRVKFLYRVSDPESARILEAHQIKETPKMIKQKLFSQDHAVEQVFKSIKISAAGLKEKNKPVGAFILTGPTGTGKTELAKLLAKTLNYHFVRFDMSEFSLPHTVTRFTGAPPSYLGYGEKTILEKEVGSDGKKVVLLLDEMEKAHVDIQKIMLQAMDNGKITVGTGQEVNFENTLILMTSNLGTITRQSVGFTGDDKILTVNQEALNQYFLPEFRGRLTGIIEFNPLSRNHAAVILQKFVDEFVKTNLLDKGKTLELSEKAFNEIINQGFNSFYGARPLKNALNRLILEKIADLLLFNHSSDKGVVVDYSEEEGFKAYYRQLNPSRTVAEEISV